MPTSEETNQKILDILVEFEESNKKLTNLVMELSSFCSVLQKRTQHLYLLFDMVTSNLPPNSMYEIMRITDAAEIPDNPIEQNAFVLRRVTDIYLARRNSLVERIKMTEDEDEKKLYEKNLTELDNIYNLMSTLDENSSTEYVKNITSEVKICLSKMVDLRNPPEDV